ncbi:aldo/keto reductase [Nitrospira japonica]|nr:aldo/keto reductase [Nitrospira japonica]
MSAPSRPPNRLVHQTSPYLLQHAHNPVDWFPWGPEALELARTRNRPILLSIGYSACHWCHVMERESFENESIAALMNRHFVCVKVDREERPDLDEIYMQATVRLNRGQGGWPMTVFLTPEQQPFFAGTYFPPDDRWGRPGFPAILKKIAEVWERDSGSLRTQAQELTDRLTQEAHATFPMTVSETVLTEAVREFRDEFDARYGGFGSAPKFPPAAGLSLLLRCHRRSGDPSILQMVTKTLDAMSAGGIYDHIGGGFARYSTDERWLVPHFEKMLYDNALLTRSYLEAFQVTGKAAYRAIVQEVLDYVLREMTGKTGGFYSSTDADSEGVEGKFFVWTPAQVRAVLTNEEDATRFCACYDITEQGNWEHQSIPNRLRPIEEVARELRISIDELQNTVDRCRPLLYQSRAQRQPPGLDDKVITAWNGMMLGTLAEAGRVLGMPRYIEASRRAADFLLTVHRTASGRLLRTSRNEHAHLDGVLEDYAFLAEGLIDLFEACGMDRYLSAAQSLGELILTSFRDEVHGGFFTSSREHETLIMRSREGPDGATPSGNAVAAFVLARLAHHGDRQDFREAAVGAIRAYGKQITRYPKAFAKSLAVVDFVTEGPLEIALVGREMDPALQSFTDALRSIYLPNRILAVTHQVDGTSTHPLLAGKTTVNGTTALYLCRDFTCQRPITDPGETVAAVHTAQKPSSANAGDRSLNGQMLAGFATAEGTAKYAARQVNHPNAPPGLENGYVPFGATGLTVSKVGFGTYRIDMSDREYTLALETALRNGVNLIDTSTNYMDGDSERVIGLAIRRLNAEEALSRSELIMVSKIGYVQGQTLARATAREQSGTPYPDMVKYGEGIWHCIHPEFLADQLTASLDRLGLQGLDVCLLHNPEYFLSEAGRRKDANLEEIRESFYRRIQDAFAFFESQVALGRIRWYGVSSNSVASEADATDATSLSRFLAAAEAAAASQGQSQHHFAVLQCPMNLFEAGPLRTHNTGNGLQQTVLSLAGQSRLAVLVNRPLNAMADPKGGMLRLADLPHEGHPVDVETQVKKVGQLEQEYRDTLASSISNPQQGLQPTDFFNWATELKPLEGRLHGLEHWEQIEHQVIAPHVNQTMQAVPRLLAPEMADRWEEWRERYVPELLNLLRGLRHHATEKSRQRRLAVTALLDPLLPENRRMESLSRKALWIVSSTPGVTCVLNGMRSPSYVKDSIEVLRWANLAQAHSIYDRMPASTDV